MIGTVLIFTSNYKKTLTLNIIKDKVSEKGENLTWEDFDDYESKEIGSGLYILLYEISDTYEFKIGGILNEKPMYMRLELKENNDIYIDIRYDDIDKFTKNIK